MPDFEPIRLEHKSVFDTFFAQDPPQASELTFTNLFMWRLRYRPVWKAWNDCLLIIMQPEGEAPFGLPPTGTGDKSQALSHLWDEVAALSSEPRICRVGESFVARHVDTERFLVREDQDNSDYVYLARDLIDLPGNKFHRKKNHLNKFVKTYPFAYRSLDLDLVDCFLRMQEDWCELRDCGDSPELIAEDRAVYEALVHFEELSFTGGAILINNKVEAFSLGELLNPDTAVIHIEKANPDIPGLYAAINQRFCMDAWSEAKFINREQDLGVEGLRKAKQSYQPHHMVRKFIVTRVG
jgi:uncharacterized protein